MAMSPMLHRATFIDSTPLLGDPVALRARAAEMGFLVFRGQLPVEQILGLRLKVLEILNDMGWLDPQRPLLDGIAAGTGSTGPEINIDGDRNYREVYKRIIGLREFNALACCPEVLRICETLFGEPVLAHPRNICRLIFPQRNLYTTPPHQDFLHVKGTHNTWTAWLSLGDCPLWLGGLAVAAGTHRAGLRKHVGAYGAGGAGVETPDDVVWYEGDMVIGDFILLHSLTIHQGRDNQTPDVVRLSCDFRYQPASEPVHHSSLKPHMGWSDWNDIYADWAADDPLRYYWQAQELNVVQ